MKTAITLDKARKIAAAAVAARKKWGLQVSLPFSVEQLTEALVVMADAGCIAEAGAGEELTKLRRQLAAANARVKKLSKSNKRSDGDYPE